MHVFLNLVKDGWADQVAGWVALNDGKKFINPLVQNLTRVLEGSSVAPASRQ